MLQSSLWEDRRILTEFLCISWLNFGFIVITFVGSLKSRRVLLIIANDWSWLMRGFLHAGSKFIFGSHKKRDRGNALCLPRRLQVQWVLQGVILGFVPGFDKYRSIQTQAFMTGGNLSWHFLIVKGIRRVYSYKDRIVSATVFVPWATKGGQTTIIIIRYTVFSNLYYTVYQLGLGVCVCMYSVNACHSLCIMPAAAYPILDVMVAVDQGCGCSDLFFRREVGIWKTTCKGKEKRGITQMCTYWQTG